MEMEYTTSPCQNKFDAFNKNKIKLKMFPYGYGEASQVARVSRWDAMQMQDAAVWLAGLPPMNTF